VDDIGEDDSSEISCDGTRGNESGLRDMGKVSGWWSVRIGAWTGNWSKPRQVRVPRAPINSEQNKGQLYGYYAYRMMVSLLIIMVDKVYRSSCKHQTTTSPRLRQSSWNLVLKNRAHYNN
jgi:hypothetical protein